jgi:predicted signal transduction protein with EAL and GGDEF domain
MGTTPATSCSSQSLRGFAQCSARRRAGAAGGDEFVLLCEGLHVPEEAEMVAGRIGAVLRRPFQLSITCPSAQYPGSPSTGTAGVRPRLSCAIADFAMYEAKRQGGGRHRLVDAAARSAAEAYVDLGDDLRLAQRRRQLHWRYQPSSTSATARCGRSRRCCAGRTPPEDRSSHS